MRDGQSKKCGGGEDLGNHEKIRIGVLHRPKVSRDRVAITLIAWSSKLKQADLINVV